ncbi:MAG: hypothetical protein ACLFQY_14715 [Desulfococcaceae bacterium]
MINRSMYRSLVEERDQSLWEQTNDEQAIRLLKEQIEALEWYERQIESCDDPQLKSVLAENRDKGKQNAAMLIEWIRRRDDTFHRELSGYLFSDKALPFSS